MVFEDQTNYLGKGSEIKESKLQKNGEIRCT
jgi:hypothetical protein